VVGARAKARAPHSSTGLPQMHPRFLRMRGKKPMAYCHPVDGFDPIVT
jgi:hypothetical protein